MNLNDRRTWLEYMNKLYERTLGTHGHEAAMKQIKAEVVFWNTCAPDWRTMDETSNRG